MVDLDTIHNLVKKIDVKVDKLCNWQGAVEERCQNRASSAAGMKRTVYGDNGRGGLVADVKQLQDCKKETGKWRSFVMGVAKTVVSAVIIAIIMWFILMYKQH